METWKLIEGFGNYSVSDHGNVKNNKTERIITQHVEHGYKRINIKHNNKSNNRYVHALVANAFINNLEGKRCVDHIDNDKSNNNLINLRWATHSQNSQNKSMMSNNTSGVKGVVWDKHTKKWKAQIMIDGVCVYLGSFDNIEDAKEARIKRANEAFGIFTHSCEKII